MRRIIMRTIYNRSWVLDILVALLLVTTIFFLVGQKNQTQKIEDLANQNKLLNEQMLQQSAEIKSCTDPAGACYKNNQQNSKLVVENINKVSVFAAYCAAKTPPYVTVVQVRKCVEAAITGKEPIQTK